MVRIGIVGGTGYTGVELLRLLTPRDDVRIVFVTSRGEAGTPVDAVFPNLRGCCNLAFVAPEAAPYAECDIVFFATPNGTAMRQVPELLAAGVRVIDVSADFRLRDAAVWAHWYGGEHECPDLLAEAVYGLPELHREAIRGARLVANPGCYPTAVTLGLLPLVEAGLVPPHGIIADAKSGATGAGRHARVDTLLAEQGDNFRAYGAAGHRHLPEIRQALADGAGSAVDLTFVPHLAPQVRGIHATLYAELARDADVQDVYEQRFAAEPFVDVMPPGSHPQTRSVRGANVCRLAVHRPDPQGARVVVLAVIDNLVKGAAGQAIQNLNLMSGVDEGAGLLAPGMLP